MIFVTVGTQLPFDRLVLAVDRWAGEHSNQAVFAQVGPNAAQTQFIRSTEFVTPTEFDRYASEAEVIVAHAGMGSILTALRFGKPVVVMPRKADLQEQRNDHQLATADRFRGRSGVLVASDEHEIAGCLDRSRNASRNEAIGPWAQDALIDAIRSAIVNKKQ